MIRIIRFFIILVMIPMGIILYYFAVYGSPIIINQPLSYGADGQGSWTYSVTEPIFGIVFIGIGLFGDTHPLFRITCLIGCGGELFGTALISYQVYYFIQQVNQNNSPSYRYTLHDLNVLYWSSVIIISMCTFIFMSTSLLCCIVGWCSPQLIHPSHISGKDLDRCEVMRNQILHRLLVEKYVLGINTKNNDFIKLKPTNAIENENRESIADNKDNNTQQNVINNEEEFIL